MVIDNRININAVKPVTETQPAQLNADKLPDLSFEELLRQDLAKHHSTPERAQAKRHEQTEREKQSKNTTPNAEAVNNSATMMASYAMLEQIMRAQNRHQKDQQVSHEEIERTL